MLPQMTAAQVGELELDLAWRRTLNDSGYRWFVEHPHILQWIELDRAAWLHDVSQQLMAGHPGYDNTICYIPKPGWMMRPGSTLDLRDSIVYTALVGRFFSTAYPTLRASQGVVDMAYAMRPPDDVDWMERAFAGWENWTRVSLQKLDAGIAYVVVADIAGFYDNINLPILASRLRNINPGQAYLDHLMARLNRWAKADGKGIPQGHSASDVLAKIFFAPIDRGLTDLGLDHLRYVDDIRIFCRTHLEAQRALAELTNLLHTNGLTLQTAKTKIYSAERARQKFDGVKPIISRIQEGLKEELRGYLGANPYITAEDIEAAFMAHAGEINGESFELAFAEHFLEDSGEFDKTLLHYLLTRLGQINSRVAVDYCISLMRSHPEEMRYPLGYLKKVRPTGDQLITIIEYMESEAAIYDYQLYELVKWFSEVGEFPERLVRLCRQWYFDRNRKPWLRSYCLEVLSRNATAADLDRIFDEYQHARNNCERAEIAYALRGLERGRRNAFYGRIRPNSNIIERAIRQVL